MLPTLPVPTNEEVLVQRLLARDVRARRQMDECYGKNLLVMIRRVVREEAQARDILQEGLLKIWLSIGSYDAGRGRLYT